jgi:DNA-binding transcriptional MerR regulator
MKIPVVSERLGVSPDILGCYEGIGFLLPVNRADSGFRDYSKPDVRRVEFIKCMRSAELPIEVLIGYGSLAQQGDRTMQAGVEILIEQRAQLKDRMAKLQKTPDLLNYKISVYENALVEQEQELLEIEAEVT